MAGGALAITGGVVAVDIWRRARPENADQRWRDAWAVLIPGVLGASVIADTAQNPTAAKTALQTCLARVDALVSGIPERARAELKQLLLIGELPGLRKVALGMPAAWSDLSPAQMDAVLDGWTANNDARLREAAISLRALVRMAWYSQPATWAAIGYPGPPDLS
jgi:hypothetical protein